MTEPTSPVAIVTGASRGIGRATARALARNGFSIVLAARDTSALETVASEIAQDGGAVLSVTTDVSRERDVFDLFDAVRDRFGRIDLLVNNAGVAPQLSPIANVELEEWNRVIATNLTGTFLCTRSAVRLMSAQRPEGGRIINVGSLSAHVPRPNTVAYSASKTGITGLTRLTSLEGRRSNIACGQIDIGNAASDGSNDAFAQREQADGSRRDEPFISFETVADAIAHMAALPLSANVQFLTVMATAMPYIGRG